jgi:hypothetical protein
MRGGANVPPAGRYFKTLNYGERHDLGSGVIACGSRDPEAGEGPRTAEAGDAPGRASVRLPDQRSSAPLSTACLPGLSLLSPYRLSMTSEQVYSINGAAELTGYSLPTVRKRLPDLQKHGAIQVQGRWQIPLSALHQAGLMQRVTVNPDREAIVAAFRAETMTEVETLRKRVSEAEQRAAVAEALAEERQRSLDRADRALLALEQKLTAPPTFIASAPASPEPSQRPRRGWLERLRGD